LARIGHRPFVVRLVNGTKDTAGLLERHLFDLGYLVYVPGGAENLASAVQTAFQAGLVTIVVGPAADDPAVAGDRIPPDQIVTLDRAQFEEDADLLDAAVRALASGDPGNVRLTDGAGI
jgi:hypothetical protein